MIFQVSPSCLLVTIVEYGGPALAMASIAHTPASLQNPCLALEPDQFGHAVQSLPPASTDTIAQQVMIPLAR